MNVITLHRPAFDSYKKKVDFFEELSDYWCVKDCDPCSSLIRIFFCLVRTDVSSKVGSSHVKDHVRQSPFRSLGESACTRC